MSGLPPRDVDPAGMSPSDDRLYDLAIARATVGLSAAESEEFAELARAVPPSELDAVADAVAALTRGFAAEEEPIELGGNHAEPMPAGLLDRLLADAERFVREASAPSEVRSRDAAVIASLRRQVRNGWLAAAACLVVAAAAFLVRGGGGASARPPSIRDEVDASGDAVHVALASTPAGTAGASGDVVWSERLQKGYLTLTGVPANDAAKAQYQLWIVDKERDKEPVDGGVFDVASDGSVIAFVPRLPVHHPEVFAITAEQPGGVVVSEGPILMAGASKSS